MCPVVHVAPPPLIAGLQSEGRKKSQTPELPSPCLWIIPVFTDYVLTSAPSLIHFQLPSYCERQTPPPHPISLYCFYCASTVGAVALTNNGIIWSGWRACASVPPPSRLTLNNKNVQQSATVLKIRVRWDEEHEQRDWHCFLLFNLYVLFTLWLIIQFSDEAYFCGTP